MAYYNPVLRAQENIARSLERGLSRIGEQPLRKAEFGLREAGLMHQIAREKTADELALKQFGLQEAAGKRAGVRLGMEEEAHELSMRGQRQNIELAAQNAQRAQWLFEKQKAGILFNEQQAKKGLAIAEQQGELRRQHLTARGMAPFILGPQAGVETIADWTSQGKTQQIAKLTGSRIVKDNGYIKFLKKNGQFATWEDMPRFLPIIEDVMKTTADPVYYLQQKIREFEEVRDKAGGPLSPEAEKWYIQAKKNVKDPDWEIAQREKQNARSLARMEKYGQAGMDTTMFTNRMARNDRKINEAQGRKVATAKAALSIRFENIKAAAKKGAKVGWAEFLYEVNKDENGKPTITKAEAADIVRSDESYNERLKAAAAEFKARETNIMMETDPEVVATIIQEIRDTYNLVPQAIGETKVANPVGLDIDMEAYQILTK